MLLMIDNYDSFTYNLVQYLGELGVAVKVIRNDQVSFEELKTWPIQKLFISPGPCTPREAGVSCEAIAYFAEKHVPVFGVCLGHQCMGDVFGGKVIRAPYLMHGKVSAIHHWNQGIFQGIPSPFTATRYHSLIIERDSCPDVLEITAETEDGLIMGVRHRDYPVFGVQFHPESILTEHGHQMLQNFLKMV